MNQVCQVEQSVERISNDALRIAQNEVLIGVAVGADVGLEITPGNRSECDTDVGDDAVVLGVDLVLGDVEVRVIELARRKCGHLASRTRRRQEILCIVGLRPDHQTHQRAYVTLVDLIVVGVGVGHRQIGVQPGIDLRLRGARNVDATVVRAWDYTALVVEGSSEAVVDPVVRGRAAE